MFIDPTGTVGLDLRSENAFQEVRAGQSSIYMNHLGSALDQQIEAVSAGAKVLFGTVATAPLMAMGGQAGAALASNYGPAVASSVKSIYYTATNFALANPAKSISIATSVVDFVDGLGIKGKTTGLPSNTLGAMAAGTIKLIQQYFPETASTNESVYNNVSSPLKSETFGIPLNQIQFDRAPSFEANINYERFPN